MTRLLLSASITELGVMRAHWERHAALQQAGKVGTDSPIGRAIDLGGAIASIDIDRVDDRLWTLPLSCPAGVAFTPQRLFVASMRENRIDVFDHAMQSTGRIDHPWMNDPHGLSVDRERGTILLASSGVDSILEFDYDGTLAWSWTAYDHGLRLDQFGRTIVRPFDADFRAVDYPTLHQSTHVNCALSHRETVFAVLFHQGAVVGIERATGEWRTVIAGLNHPHSLRRTESGFMVCDTRGGRVLFLDGDFRTQRTLPVACQWIADALELPDGRIVVVDGASSRLITFDSAGEQRDVIAFPSEWKLFSIEIVPDSWNPLPMPADARNGLTRPRSLDSRDGCTHPCRGANWPPI